MLRWKPGMAMEELEREAVTRTLAHYGGNRARTARALRISLGTVRSKIRRYDLPGPEKPQGRPKSGK